MGFSPRSLHRSQSLHEQTYQALRTAILTGELAGGDRGDRKIDRAVTQAEKATTQESHPLTTYQLLHLDYEFHRLIAKSASNPWLMSLLDQVFDKMTLLRISDDAAQPSWVRDLQRTSTHLSRDWDCRSLASSCHASYSKPFDSKQRAIHTQIQQRLKPFTLPLEIAL